LPSTYTLSVEVVSIGELDPNAPSALGLAHLASATGCTSWARNATSLGSADIVVRLLVSHKPSEELVHRLRGLPDVRHVTTGSPLMFTKAPEPLFAGDVRNRVPCRSGPI
jgi:hypothetical protein